MRQDRVRSVGDTGSWRGRWFGRILEPWKLYQLQRVNIENPYIFSTLARSVSLENVNLPLYFILQIARKIIDVRSTAVQIVMIASENEDEVLVHYLGIRNESIHGENGMAEWISVSCRKVILNTGRYVSQPEWKARIMEVWSLQNVSAKSIYIYSGWAFPVLLLYLELSHRFSDVTQQFTLPSKLDENLCIDVEQCGLTVDGVLGPLTECLCGSTA